MYDKHEEEGVVTVKGDIPKKAIKGLMDITGNQSSESIDDTIDTLIDIASRKK